MEEIADRRKLAVLPARLQESLETSLHGHAAIGESARALVNIVEVLRNPKEQDAAEYFEFSLQETHVMDAVARSTLLALVEQARQDGDHLMSWQRGKIRRFLEVVADLSFQPVGHRRLDTTVMFAVLEDLMDMATLPECEQVFSYMESIWEFLPKTGTRLGLLRTFNKLLKRLSKTRDTVLSGRILMFMATIWPLSERSAANTTGAFNSNIEVVYSREEELNAEGLQINATFYRTFWSLQESFRHNVRLTAAPSLATFLDGLQVVFTLFAEQPVDPGAPAAGGGEEEAAAGAGCDISYLTSPKLLNLQLRNANFRRHFLLQALYAFQWLQAERRSGKGGVKGGKGGADAVAEGAERLAALEAQARQLLRGLPPLGARFAALVEHVLDREKNWLLWKYTAAPAAAQPGKAGGGAGAPQTCPAIEREPLAGPAVLKGPGKRKAVRRVALGNEVLARVWHSTRGDPMAALRGAGRRYVPDYMDYMSRLAQEMDPESGIEEEYKVANSQVYEWRGLRLSVRHNAAAFGGIAKEGGGLTALLPKELRPASLAGSEEAKDEAAEEASQGGNQEGPPQDDEEGGGDGAAEGESVLGKEGRKGNEGEAGAEKEEAAEAEGDTAGIERDKGQEQERQAEAGQGGRLQETAQGEVRKQGSEEHAGEGAGRRGDEGTGEEQSPPTPASAGPTGRPEEAKAPAQGGPQGAAAQVLEKETEAEAQGGEATRGEEAGEEGAEGGGSVPQGQPVQDREAARTKGGEASADGALMAGLEERIVDELLEATASPSTLIDDLVGPAARAASGADFKGESAKAEGRGAEGPAEEPGKEVAAVTQGPGRGRGRGRGKRKPEDNLPDATPRRTTRRKR